jgi:hypothetical protein
LWRFWQACSWCRCARFGGCRLPPRRNDYGLFLIYILSLSTYYTPVILYTLFIQHFGLVGINVSRIVSVLNVYKNHTSNLQTLERFGQ